MQKVIGLFGLVLCLGGRVLGQVETFGLMQGVVIEQDTTVILTRDYIVDPTHILQASATHLQCKLSADKDSLLLIRTKTELPGLSTLSIKTTQDTYDIIVKRTRKETITFRFNPGNKQYNAVSIVGDLTNWNPNLLFMQQQGAEWVIELQLNPGRYQYQIVADGQWFLDPNNRDSIDNGIGGYNSLLVVGNNNQSPKPFMTTSYFFKFDDDQKQQTHIALHYNLKTPELKLIAFWNNYQIPIDTLWIFSEETYEEEMVLIVSVPNQAELTDRSSIRIYGSVNNREINDILIPLRGKEVIKDPSLLDKNDFRKNIMYFLMVDRFCNGTTANDQPVQDDRVADVANYMGGDFAGIQTKIESGYFEQLGVNTIWISPVFQNPMIAYQEYPAPHRWFSGYHGYWPISLSKVDVRFGKQQEFAALVDSLHAHDMQIYLDYVANHIHAEHPLWTQHPEWFSQLDLGNGRKNLRLWDEHRLTTWFEPYMPSFDHAQPQVAEACADSAMFWLKTYGIDGFRHDATKHIETDFWRLLTYKIKTEVSIPQQKPVYQIGETFGSRELIGSYLGSGLLDAQFDFNLYFDARSVFAQQDIPFSRLSASLNESFNYFGWHHVMGNLTGNHDMARFISYASGDLKWNENDKEAGWNRTIRVTDPVGYKRLMMLHAFNMTIPGIPIIYYGDEIGMPGANDPDNRRMMYFAGWSAEETEVYNTVRQLTQLRSHHMALLYGDYIELPIKNGAETEFAYLRNYFEDKVVTIMHKGDSPLEVIISLPVSVSGLIPHAQFGSTVRVEDNQLFVSNHEGNCFEIITFDAR